MVRREGLATLAMAVAGSWTLGAGPPPGAALPGTAKPPTPSAPGSAARRVAGPATTAAKAIGKPAKPLLAKPLTAGRKPARPLAARSAPSSPIAHVWISAATVSGIAARMLTTQSRLGRTALARTADGDPYVRRVTVQLGAPAPSAATPPVYVPPPGLGVGAGATLATPALSTEPIGLSDPAVRPYGLQTGRTLYYWGCGEHAGPGQPFVLDSTRPQPGTKPPNPGRVGIPVEQPPSQATSPIYGVWTSGAPGVPPQGSLVGPHAVRGPGLPDIRFILAPGQDFMPPLRLASGSPSAAGALRLQWNVLPMATGYQLTLVSAPTANGDVVVWTSSASPLLATGGFGLSDYVAPGNVRRLVATKVFLPPQTGACLVPAEVARASSRALVSMIAYGPETIFTSPPGAPSGRRWAAKVRFKSTTELLLGRDGAFPATVLATGAPAHAGLMSAEASDKVPSANPPRP